MATELFLVCAPAETSALQVLEMYLAPLVRQGLILRSTNLDIDPGLARSEELIRKLSTAEITLLLISAPFLASDECMDLSHRAMTLGQTVVLVLLRDADWRAEFSHLPALPRTGTPVLSAPSPDAAWGEVTRAIRELVEQRGGRQVQRVVPGNDLPGTTGEARPRRVPTLGSLKQFIKHVLPRDALFNTFCLIHFRDVHFEFAANMNRSHKLDLLLESADPGAILDALRGDPEHAGRCRQYEHELAFE